MVLRAGSEKRNPIPARGHQNAFRTSFWFSDENSPISDLTDGLGMVLRACSEKRNPISTRGHLGSILWDPWPKFSEKNVGLTGDLGSSPSGWVPKEQCEPSEIGRRARNPQDCRIPCKIPGLRGQPATCHPSQPLRLWLPRQNMHGAARPCHVARRPLEQLRGYILGGKWRAVS